MSDDAAAPSGEGARLDAALARFRAAAARRIAPLALAVAPEPERPVPEQLSLSLERGEGDDPPPMSLPGMAGPPRATPSPRGLVERFWGGSWFSRS